MNASQKIMLYLSVTRALEVVYSRHLEKDAKEKGAIEYGKEHYSLIVALHVSFIFSIFFEGRKAEKFNLAPLTSFIVLELLRYAVILTLGSQWNTKILIHRNSYKLESNIYKYIKHPNYRIIQAEIFILPLVVNAKKTSLVFGLLNLIILELIRIPSEEAALRQYPTKNSV